MNALRIRVRFFARRSFIPPTRWFLSTITRLAIRPSQADHRLTRQLVESAKLLQIVFLDHIIIGLPDGGRKPYFSFREAGAL